VFFVLEPERAEGDSVEEEGFTSMKLSARIPASAALLLVLVSTVGCTKLRARDQLVKGVQSFKSGKYEEAVNHFQTSIQLDPDYDAARLYLATAYSYQIVANLDTPENLAVAKKALDGFDYVLNKNPNDIDALRQVASIHRNIKQYDAAKADELKILSIKPDDAEAAYTVGVIDWTQAYKHATDILAAAGMQDDGNGNVKMSKDVCAKLVAANSALVDEALKFLQQAIDHKANYDDAMQYMNLTYRRKADLECGNDAARKADLAQADMWSQKSMGARKAIEAEKEEKANHGVVADK
jgi:tetratricopeptide (TPR) repeat protein